MSSTCQPGLLERLPGRLRGRAGEVGEVVGDRGLRDDRCERRLAVALGPLVAGDHQRAGAVVDARRVAGRVAAVLHEDRRQLGERLDARVAPRRLVDLDDGVALLALDRDRARSPRAAGPRRSPRPRADASAATTRPCRRGSARAPAATSLASWAMCLPENGFVSPSLIIPSIALPSPIRKPKRACLSRYGAFDIDSIPPPTPTSRSPARIAVSSMPVGADAGGADLVDRLRGDLLRDAGLELRLARGDLPLAGLEHLAHHDVLDLLGLDLRTLERGLDRGRAELGRVEARKAASELADRRTGGGEDHGLGHRHSLQFVGVCRTIVVRCTRFARSHGW